tara:strand:+ start:998 stop:1183 length:186 start_codon:yes stop_codon:yes gene_type:complete
MESGNLSYFKDFYNSIIVLTIKEQPVDIDINSFIKWDRLLQYEQWKIFRHCGKRSVGLQAT